MICPYCDGLYQSDNPTCGSVECRKKFLNRNSLWEQAPFVNFVINKHRTPLREIDFKKGFG